MAELIHYGSYIPKYRVSTEDIARVWNKDAREIIGALKIQGKAVPAKDEDSVTIALEAAYQAVQTSGVSPDHIGALFVGSESHPYAVNPTATIVGEFLGINHHYHAADLEFACKAGTAGVQMVASMVDSGQISYGLAIGADTAQGKPHDILEYTSAAAGVALLMGKEQGIARLMAYSSYATDTPDFWRRDGMRYPTHAGRFTGEPSYFHHVSHSTKYLLEKVGKSPEDIDWCVFHMPNGKFPRDIAKRLGFSETQLAPSLTVDSIGNPYSASALLGFAATLDQAKPGQSILLISYGSGAGSDAFLWETTDALVQIQEQRRKHGVSVLQQIQEQESISYVDYLRFTHILE